MAVLCNFPVGNSIDNELSTTSTNPISNKAVTTEINKLKKEATSTTEIDTIISKLQ